MYKLTETNLRKLTNKVIIIKKPTGKLRARFGSQEGFGNEHYLVENFLTRYSNVQIEENGSPRDEILEKYRKDEDLDKTIIEELSE